MMNLDQEKPIRNPKTPCLEAKIKASELVSQARERFPWVSQWWFALPNSLVTLIPLADFPLDQFPENSAKLPQCSMVNHGEGQEFCNLDTDFILMTVYFNKTKKVHKIRLRGFCSRCLYLSMSETLTSMLNPDFFEETSGSETSDPQIMYLIGERIHFFQSNMSHVFQTLKEKKPDLFNELCQTVKSFSKTV